MNAAYKVLGFASKNDLNADLLFSEMDTNEDGMVDQQEFIAACQKNEKLMGKLLGCPISMNIM